MRTIEITEAKEWKQTLIDVAQSLQDKAAIQGELSEWDKRVYDEVVEIEKKLDSIEQKESKGEWKNYKLIPMSDITDEAREIAVAWMECEDKDWIGQKHKLASDIMNYARKHADQQPQKVEEEEKPTDLKDEFLKFLKWYNKLSPADKCTVHPPAGSGGCHGLYNLTDAGLINIYLSKTSKQQKAD